MSALVATLCCAHDPVDLPPPPLPLWPWPSSVTHGESTTTVSSRTFTLVAANSNARNSDVLTAGLERYAGYAFGAVDTPGGSRRACPRSGAAAAPLTKLEVSVLEPTTDSYMRVHTNESYDLWVPDAGSARLEAQTAIGAVRGLETFSQLLQLRGKGLCEYKVAKTPIHVADRPRYTHRGFLVDTGRNYHSPAFLKKTIETLSWNKLSVFHWHVTESDAFPLQLDSLPTLGGAGAFGSTQVSSTA